MATRVRRDPVREQLAELATLRTAGGGVAATARLRSLLGASSGYVVAEAARLASTLELEDLAPALEAAFARLLDDGVARDPGCTGKRAVVEALAALGVRAHDVYRAGLRCVQLEPAFPERVDTAPPVRGASAHALVRTAYARALREVGALLVDPFAAVRVEAARALAECRSPGAAELLRLKASVGDVDADVLGACLRGVLGHEGGDGVAFVSPFADQSGAVGEAALLALGESRLESALPVLVAAFETTGRRRRCAALALALARRPEATTRLLDALGAASDAVAADAAVALALLAYEPATREHIERVLTSRGSPALWRAFRDASTTP